MSEMTDTTTETTETNDQRFARIAEIVGRDSDSDAVFLVREIDRLRKAIDDALDLAESYSDHLHRGTDEPKPFYAVLTEAMETTK